MPWNFTDHVSCERQNRLFNVKNFGEIVSLVANDLYEIAYLIEPKKTGITGEFLRPVFTFCLHSEVSDPLFNSPVGYRGQLYQSKEVGISASQELISAIEENLLKASHFNPDCACDSSIILKSLHNETAKLWPCKLPREKWNKLKVCPLAQIDLPKWQQKAESNDPRLAKAGLKAPRFRRFEIKGAWINGDGETCIDGKTPEERTKNIQEMGWT